MNKYTLLAGVAVFALTTTNAMSAMTGEQTTSIGANVQMFSPWTVDSTEIYFPDTTITPGGTVTITPAGVISSSSGTNYITRKNVTAAGTVTATMTAWPTAFAAGARSYLVLPNEVSMTITSADVSADVNKSCGKLKTMTQAIPTSLTGNEYVVKYGGTFEIDADIDKKITSTFINCHGSETITVINTTADALPEGIGTY